MTNPDDIKMAHVKEMAEAAAENGQLIAHAAAQLLKELDLGSSSYISGPSNPKKSKLAGHKKASWLLNLAAFEQARKNRELRPCRHVDPVSPGMYFYLLASYPEKTLLCIECCSSMIQELSKASPDTCDLCDTRPHQIFHEAMVNVGAINIYGNVCRGCARKYLKK